MHRGISSVTSHGRCRPPPGQIMMHGSSAGQTAPTSAVGWPCESRSAASPASPPVRPFAPDSAGCSSALITTMHLIERGREPLRSPHAPSPRSRCDVQACVSSDTASPRAREHAVLRLALQRATNCVELAPPAQAPVSLAHIYDASPREWSLERGVPAGSSGADRGGEPTAPHAPSQVGDASSAASTRALSATKTSAVTSALRRGRGSGTSMRSTIRPGRGDIT